MSDDRTALTEDDFEDLVIQYGRECADAVLSSRAATPDLSAVMGPYRAAAERLPEVEAERDDYRTRCYAMRDALLVADPDALTARVEAAERREERERGRAEAAERDLAEARAALSEQTERADHEDRHAVQAQRSLDAAREDHVALLARVRDEPEVQEVTRRATAGEAIDLPLTEGVGTLVVRLRVERDEARADRDWWKQRHTEDMRRVVGERDEARDALARVEEQVEAVEGLSREPLGEDAVAALRLCARGLRAALAGDKTGAGS